jgi:hypothetical protein
MKHNTVPGRPCNANDLILTMQGVQCCNCLAIEESKTVDYSEYSEYALKTIYKWHNANGICTCKACWPMNREKYNA